MGFWGFIDTSSITALIPFVFGLIIFFCFLISEKRPNLNKVVAHAAVLLTIVILISLMGTRLPKSIDTGGVGLVRVIVMISTSSLAIIIFLKSFIDARRK
jgi:hypothetical protein|tara:strand:- start:158 stop:457 length:300 start_codon:yes stop_codon:yes gene_type:complete